MSGMSGMTGLRGTWGGRVRASRHGLPSALLLLGIVSGAGWAQESPPLQTDRPTQTEGAAIVPRGLFQLEVGVTHVFDRVAEASASRLTNVGSSVLRAGVLDPLELRLGWLGWQRTSTEGADPVTGLNDLSLGAKVRVARGRGVSPAVTVSGTVLVPVGDTAFRAGGVDPAVRVALSHDLGHGLGLGYNVAALWATTADDTGAESLQASLAYTLALTGQIAPRIALFGEGYGASGLTEGSGTWIALDAGVIVLVLPALQVDATGGVGLGEGAADWFLGVGVAVRAPR